MFHGKVGGGGGNSVNSAANIWGIAANTPKELGKEFGKSAGVGLGGAVLAFGIDQGANKWERDFETDTLGQSKIFNEKDSQNNIGVIALQ